MEFTSSHSNTFSMMPQATVESPPLFNDAWWNELVAIPESFIHDLHAQCPSVSQPYNPPDFSFNPVPMYDTDNRTSPPKSRKQRKTRSARSPDAQNMHKAPKRRRLSERQRYEEMQNDAFIKSFTPTQVTCAGCDKTIKLDKRDGVRYYSGFWKRHKSCCGGVAAGMVRYLVSHAKKLY